MDSNYKNIRQKLNEESSLIPNSLNWENMESGIASKMERIAAEGKASRRTNTSKKYMFYGGLILLLLLIPFVCTEVSKDSELLVTEGNVEEKENVNANLDKRSNPTESLSGINVDQGNLENNPVEENKNAIAVVSEKLVNKQTSTLEFESTTQVNIVNGPDQDITQSNSEIEASNELNGFAQRQMSISEDQVKSIVENNVDEKRDDTDRNTLKEPIQVALLSQQMMNGIKHSLNPLTIQNDMIISNKPIKTKLPNRLSIHSGAALWNMGYGSTVPEQDQYETQLVSFSTQFNYQHSLKHNFFLMSGLHYQQLYSRLDWTNVIDDYKVQLEDVVVEIQTNSLTGGSTEVIGDVEVEVEAERVVRHYNSYRMLQIPIALGKMWIVGKTSFEMYLGSSLNVFGRNSGRLISEGEITDFAHNNNPFFDNKLKFNGLIGTRISYTLSENFYLSTHLQYQKSLYNWSLENQISMRPQILNFEIGFGFSLN